MITGLSSRALIGDASRRTFAVEEDVIEAYSMKDEEEAGVVVGGG
jgi:hypothetical protein